MPRIHTNLSIREEASGDKVAVRNVHEQAFGQSAEANLVDALREAEFVRHSLVAILDEQVVGHILFSGLEVSDATIDAVALAPLAVLPSHQNLGIGSALTQQGLEGCRHKGCNVVFVLGDPAYYQRFGFVQKPAEKFTSPYNCDAFLALELAADTLLRSPGGVVRYPAPFGSL